MFSRGREGGARCGDKLDLADIGGETPYIAVLALSVIAGFIVQGNFSNLTSGVLAVGAGPTPLTLISPKT